MDLASRQCVPCKGGVPPLVMLATHSADAAILAHAAEALRNVGAERRYALPLVHQGVLPPPPATGAPRRARRGRPRPPGTPRR